jgi:hypothetical protein
LTKTQRGVAPQSHHIDKRAADLLAAGLPQSNMSTTRLAAWLGTSVQWVEIGRHRGYGPPFVRIGPRRIIYQPPDIVRWLEERKHHSTAEYATPLAGPGRPRRNAPQTKAHARRRAAREGDHG